jgi:hypothetical protein
MRRILYGFLLAEFVAYIWLVIAWRLRPNRNRQSDQGSSRVSLPGDQKGGSRSPGACAFPQAGGLQQWRRTTHAASPGWRVDGRRAGQELL